MTEIMPKGISPLSRYTDPKSVDPKKMTQTYEVGHNKQFKTAEDVLISKGFEMLQRLDSGAYAVVYKGKHIAKGTIVAIKVITIPQEWEEKRKKAVTTDIKHELYILAKIRHPYIIMMISHFMVSEEHRESLHIVMQLAEGGTLAKLSEKRGPFDEDSCRVWFAQMLSAMVYMHGLGLAHRDLKLSNILLDKDNDILISDFGLSRLVWRKSRDGILESTTFCGTPPYMSPELLQYSRAKQGYNAQKADVWALGVILFKLFYHEYPFPKKLHKALIKMKERKVNKCNGMRHKPSDDLIDIIFEIFNPDPYKRPNLNELTSHNWVKRFFNDEQTNTENVDSIAVKTENNR